MSFEVVRGFRIMEDRMKACLTVVLLVCCAVLAQSQTSRTFYVSVSGSDANPGTAASPWATLQKAADTAQPGDVIRVLSGVYRPVNARSYGVRITRSGTSTAPITIQGEGGRPVLDCSGLAPTGQWEMYCFDLRANGWIVKCIDVKGSQQFGDVYVGIGVLFYNASNNVIDNVRSYGNEGPGFQVGYGSASSNNRLVNCDAYDNLDPMTTPMGGNADGVQIIVPAGSNGNVVDACRAWNNSDDGFDLWKSESAVTIRNSWAFANGSESGTGFKLGRNESGPRHRVHNNLAFNNRYFGFTSNDASGALELYNNTAYGNGTHGFVNTLGNIPSVYRNNLSGNNTAISSSQPDVIDDTFNSWNLAVTVTAADFLSVSETLGSAPRNADGSLPVNNLFRLASTSDLIDKGVNLGMAYSGNAPDLGAFEVSGPTAPATPTNLRIVP